jgi:hypothetical protein
MIPIESLWLSKNCLHVVVEKSIFSARAGAEAEQQGGEHLHVERPFDHRWRNITPVGKPISNMRAATTASLAYASRASFAIAT